MCLVLEGHFEEAVHHAITAENLDPFSILNLLYASQIQIVAGEFEIAKVKGERIIELAPEFFSGYYVAGIANLALKNYEKAFTQFEKMVRLNSSTFTLSWLGSFYGIRGEELKAKEVIETMKNLEGIETKSNFHMSLVFASIGDFDTAFQYFDKAVKYRDGNAQWINAYRFMIPDFFKDPRMEGLLERIGVPILD